MDFVRYIGWCWKGDNFAMSQKFLRTIKHIPRRNKCLTESLTFVKLEKILKLKFMCLWTRENFSFFLSFADEIYCSLLSRKGKKLFLILSQCLGEHFWIMTQHFYSILWNSIPLRRGTGVMTSFSAFIFIQIFWWGTIIKINDYVERDSD